MVFKQLYNLKRGLSEGVVKNFWIIVFAVLLMLLYFSRVSRKGENGGDFMDVNSGDYYTEKRERMVERQIKSRGVGNKNVLDAMNRVPREEFVPKQAREFAYEDTPLPIGLGQTISQPYIVALMTELLELKKSDKVLEIGTGSGYQAAVIAEIVSEVYTIEIVAELAQQSAERLKNLGYENVKVRAGDGYKGWPEHAPFDGIIITAAVDHLPKPLLEQLKMGGRLVYPKGDPMSVQELEVVKKTEKGLERRLVTYVRFVPMTGEALRQKSDQ